MSLTERIHRILTVFIAALAICSAVALPFLSFPIPALAVGSTDLKEDPVVVEPSGTVLMGRVLATMVVQPADLKTFERGIAINDLLYPENVVRNADGSVEFTVGLAGISVSVGGTSVKTNGQGAYVLKDIEASAQEEAVVSFSLDNKALHEASVRLKINEPNVVDFKIRRTSADFNRVMSCCVTEPDNGNPGVDSHCGVRGNYNGKPHTHCQRYWDCATVVALANPYCWGEIIMDTDIWCNDQPAWCDWHYDYKDGWKYGYYGYNCSFYISHPEYTH